MRISVWYLSAMLAVAALTPSSAGADGGVLFAVAPWDNPCPYVAPSAPNVAPLNSDELRLAPDGCRREADSGSSAG